MGSTSFATETHCHCGTEFNGSDHCPQCHCEQFEAVCDHKVESERERASRLAGMLYDAILAKGGDYNTAATASLYLHESLLNAKCTCDQAESPWDDAAIECPLHGEDNTLALHQQQREIDAENAWLHYEENRGYGDGTDGIWT